MDTNYVTISTSTMSTVLRYLYDTKADDIAVKVLNEIMENKKVEGQTQQSTNYSKQDMQVKLLYSMSKIEDMSSQVSNPDLLTDLAKINVELNDMLLAIKGRG